MDSSGSTLVKCPPKNTTLSALQKQVWSKKGRETEIKKNILMSRSVGVRPCTACHPRLTLAFNPKSTTASRNIQRSPIVPYKR